MSFFGSLFGGSNPTLSSDIKKTGAVGSFATGLGESNLTKSSKFWYDILSGDATKQMQALAPEISSAKTRTAQDVKTNAIFGTRGGGTAAANAAAKDKLHSDITDMIGRLTGTAAGSLQSSGGSLLNTGLGAFGQEAQLSQQQMENWANSIAGRGITGGIAAAETMGLGAAGGAMAQSGAGAGANTALLAGLG